MNNFPTADWLISRNSLRKKFFLFVDYFLCRIFKIINAYYITDFLLLGGWPEPRSDLRSIIPPPTVAGEMAGRVVVYGGRGALGSNIVNRFKETGYWVASVDTRLSDSSDENILVEGETWQQQTDLVTAGVSQLLGEEKLDAVICVAGGWAGGSPASKDFIKNSEAMWKSSVWPASISASLAASHLKEGGLVVLPGAAPAVSGTPSMAGYGMAKVCLIQDQSSYDISDIMTL